jgi:hypothetical protein
MYPGFIAPVPVPSLSVDYRSIVSLDDSYPQIELNEKASFSQGLPVFQIKETLLTHPGIKIGAVMMLVVFGMFILIGASSTQRFGSNFSLIAQDVFASVPNVNTSPQPVGAPSSSPGVAPANPNCLYCVVQGHPTIDVTLIHSVLANANSPAAPYSQALFDDGVKYGIDPVFALAFFQHESTFGTMGEAKVTLSLGNSRPEQGFGENCPAPNSCYAVYPSWSTSFPDWYRLIQQGYVRGGLGRGNLSTVDTIIPVYAPPRDGNNDSAYISSVKNAIDQWRSEMHYAT